MDIEGVQSSSKVNSLQKSLPVERFFSTESSKIEEFVSMLKEMPEMREEMLCRAFERADPQKIAAAMLRDQ